MLHEVHFLARLEWQKSEVFDGFLIKKPTCDSTYRDRRRAWESPHWWPRIGGGSTREEASDFAVDSPTRGTSWIRRLI